MDLPAASQDTSSARRHVDLIDLPDLTDTLQQDNKRVVGHGSFAIVYKCLCARNGVVAVKAIVPRSFDQPEEEPLVRQVRRELGIWRRLDHPNIVPLLGTARGRGFGSEYLCMVAMWMPNGTLFDHVKRRKAEPSPPSRAKLIKGIVAGLEYLHLRSILHGNIHPANILIDGEDNARLGGFGLSRVHGPVQDELSYLGTDLIRPGASMWAAPELLYPNLYPDLQVEATPKSDIYSLGSIMLFVLSSGFPWPSVGEMEDKLMEYGNPSRPVSPGIPDAVWNLITRCWSPRYPSNRPSAQEISSFSRNELESILKSNPTSDMNIVLFGTLGCGKSSIINLLAEHPTAPVSPNVKPCTRLPQWYRLSIGNKRFRIWDTMGFHPAHGGDTDPLLPYEQAHTILRNLGCGVNLILLCVRKDGIFASLGNLYRLINDVFYDGRAPIGLVVTHCDRVDDGWWGRNEDAIARRTGIPVQSIPRVCITTVQAGRDQAKAALKALLERHVATSFARSLGPSFDPAASLRIATRCGLNRQEAEFLAKEFEKPQRHVNVVFFGDSEKSLVISLLAGLPVANVSSGDAPTSGFCSYDVNVGVKQFRIWDTVGLDTVCSWEEYSRSEAATNASRLIRHLSREGGIALLVFVKMRGSLAPSELSCYRFFCEELCGGKVPVALVVTRLESYEPMESWWDTNGNDLVKTLGGNVIGHACIASDASGVAGGSWFGSKLEESRLSVQATLDDCVSLRDAPAKRWSLGRIAYHRGDRKFTKEEGRLKWWSRG